MIKYMFLLNSVKEEEFQCSKFSSKNISNFSLISAFSMTLTLSLICQFFHWVQWSFVRVSGRSFSFSRDLGCKSERGGHSYFPSGCCEWDGGGEVYWKRYPLPLEGSHTLQLKKYLQCQKPVLSSSFGNRWKKGRRYSKALPHQLHRDSTMMCALDAGIMFLFVV